MKVYSGLLSQNENTINRYGLLGVYALCVCVLKQFKSVRYAKTSSMIYELESAALNNEYFDYLNRLTKIDLLVLDDFGLMELDPDMCRNLFELIDCREARKSTIVISQLPIAS